MRNVCQICGAPIYWQFTRARKWQPMNLDGTVHFPTCRARVAEGRERIENWYEELRREGAGSLDAQAGESGQA
jgi:hypothetical protein